MVNIFNPEATKLKHLKQVSDLEKNICDGDENPRPKILSVFVTISLRLPAVSGITRTFSK